ncbi:hypothetical protein FOA43_002831 [Brettanomyces nanus]|uniref:Uncharacterized protein n=1 Tax=Eeniella nana TaxID=13502 RepID=A0A875S2A6_EENNA|nr:uncharacterized protein FOA43_002831 [Brettanomyces nanus]QPG75476.1 hypothetical protein FOA43_002831 [Brettanomyces nanus]
MPISFELLPSKGLGFIKIFDSLYSVVNQLNAQGIRNDIKFMYRRASRLFTVQLMSYRINLFFDSELQVLLFIELNLPQPGEPWNYDLKYEGEVAHKFEFRSIYNKIFGPTFPGHLDKVSMDYYLSYSGICFKFKGLAKELRSAVSQLQGDNIVDDDGSLMQILTGSTYDINCSSICIFRGISWRQASKTLVDILPFPRQPQIYAMKNMIQEVEAGTNDILATEEIDRNGSIVIGDAICYVDERKLEISFAGHPTENSFFISIGNTTMITVFKFLGPPDDFLVKQGSCEEGSCRKNSKIHNYFRYGLDIVYNLCRGTDSVVQKIIMHSNLVHSLEFMRYERLPFSLYRKVSSKVIHYSLTGDFTYLREQMFPENSSDHKPILLDRKEYELNPTHFNSNNLFEFVDFVEADGTNGNSDFKKWGISKLYIIGNCIFEVLQEDDSISSVTLF